MSLCPNCGRCPYPEGVCEERVSRGRRFFLMGALALPMAAKIETLAPIVAPAPLMLDGTQMSMLYDHILRFKVTLGPDGHGIWLAE